MFIISYAKEFFGVNLGGNIKYISSKLLNTATAICIDLGIIKNYIDNKLSLGIIVYNLGTKIKYYAEEENLPTGIKLGFGYKNFMFDYRLVSYG